VTKRSSSSARSTATRTGGAGRKRDVSVGHVSEPCHVATQHLHEEEFVHVARLGQGVGVERGNHQGVDGDRNPPKAHAQVRLVRGRSESSAYRPGKPVQIATQDGIGHERDPHLGPGRPSRRVRDHRGESGPRHAEDEEREPRRHTNRVIG
jgi:hypothetical protein